MIGMPMPFCGGVIPKIREALSRSFAGNKSDSRVKESPGAQPECGWICLQLLEMLSQYPGGLALPVVLTSIVAKQSMQATRMDALPRACLSLHAKGLAPDSSLVSATVVQVHCVCPPSGPGHWGTWVLHLADDSMKQPLQLYASSSLTPLLVPGPMGLASAEQQQPQLQQAAASSAQHPLVGCRVRLAGALRQPSRVAAFSRGLQHKPLTGPFLPSKALVLEMDAGDPVWAAEDLAGHAVLGCMEFTRVFDLSASCQIVTAIATQDRACIDGWIAVTALPPATTDSPLSHAWGQRSESRQPPTWIPVCGRMHLQGQAPDPASSVTPLVLDADAAALAVGILPGEELLLYCPIVCKGALSSARLELGPDTIIVVKTSATASGPAGHSGRPSDASTDVHPAMDQTEAPQGTGTTAPSPGQRHQPSTAVHPSAPCCPSDAPLQLSACREGLVGGVIWARLRQVLRCQRKASRRGSGGDCLCLVVLEDGSGSRLVCLKFSDRQRLAQRLREGHTLLLVGVQAPSQAQWPAALASFVAAARAGGRPEGQAASSEVLLWREAPGTCLHDLSALPGLISSPALHVRASMQEIAAMQAGRPAAARGPGPTVCCLELLDAAIHTTRVHRFCGRSVTACCFDMDMDSDQDEQGPAAALPAAPSAPLSPSEDMSLDGLWECTFCGEECSAAEVGFDFTGSLTVRQWPEASGCSPVGAAVGAGLDAAAGLSGGAARKLGADAAALGVVAGTSAEAWRRQGAAAGTAALRKLLGTSSCPGPPPGQPAVLASSGPFVATLYAVPSAPEELRVAFIKQAMT